MSKTKSTEWARMKIDPTITEQVDGAAQPLANLDRDAWATEREICPGWDRGMLEVWDSTPWQTQGDVKARVTRYRIVAFTADNAYDIRPGECQANELAVVAYQGEKEILHMIFDKAYFLAWCISQAAAPVPAHELIHTMAVRDAAAGERGVIV